MNGEMDHRELLPGLYSLRERFNTPPIINSSIENEESTDSPYRVKRVLRFDRESSILSPMRGRADCSVNEENSILL